MIRLDQPKRRSGESVVPMINVAFLLLVFFLMVAVIAPPDPVAVTLPEGGTSIDLTTDADLVLTVAADGAVLDATGGSADLARAAGQTIVLRADAAVDAGSVARLIANLTAAGATSVELAVSPG